jgi:two-component system, OmpR family, KDP operon response regulator KdpE
MTMVLVVDDEPQIRRALRLNLRARDFDVVLASTGTSALAMVAAEHPDVVLLDLGLPDMDGMAVLETLRRSTDVAIIVLTVRDDERSRIEALGAGANDYVTKPFNMTDLVERIGAVLAS